MSPHHVAGAILALVACAAACTREPPAARVSRTDGAVMFRRGGQGEPLEALVNTGLGEGDVVTTGPDSRATIAFQSGHSVEMRPLTSLLISRRGGAAAQLGAVVLQGGVRAEAGRGDILLTIGTPFGQTAELGGRQPLVVDVDLRAGLTVLMGQVTIVGDDGQRRVVDAGNVLRLDGLIVPIGGKAADPALVLEPMSFVLLANPAHVQVRRAGTTEWTTPKKRDVLAPGDAVRTRRAADTQLQLGDRAQIRLRPDTQLSVQESAGNDVTRKARYALEGGSAAVHLSREDEVDAVHEVALGGLTAAVRPGDAKADVELRARDPSHAELVVRFGRVELSDGTTVQAGSTVSVQDGEVAGEAQPLASTHVELEPGAHTVLYYQGSIPPVAFDWRGDESFGEYRLVLAHDKDFAKPVFRETLAKTSFVYDRLEPGKYHWRVEMGDQVRKGSLVVRKGSENGCANCKRNNVINDTGEKTVVYFQQALPAITLQWKEVAGAAGYQVKVFRDGEFETPMAEKKTNTVRVSFSAGQLAEGRYFWLVTSLDASGKEVSTGKTNGLEIAYDNAITDIAIRAPRNDARERSSRLTTIGEVALGAKLYINGKAAALDRKGRFRETITLSKGRNTIVYNTLATDGVSRYHVREVIRR